MNRLHCPKGIWVGKNQSIVIADSLNHRIMKYDQGDRYGLRIAGKNISGYSPELLNEPTNVIFHAKSKSYIISDYQNRRVLQLFRRGKQRLKTIIQNIACFGLAVDDEGSIYVSDTERHEVRRYKPGRKHGKIVAGGHGQGRRLHQLNHPTYICIGDDQSVYVSDSWNDRVVRWDKGAKKVEIVAGGHGKGKNRNQLDYPAGVLVDQSGAVYVADHYNYRVMRWRNSECGEVIAGGYFSDNYPNRMRGPFLSGNFPNQLNGPEGLAFDQAGNLYVADSNNHRIQRFKIQTS
jgi:sugar lactone lactonase YvrE